MRFNIPIVVALWLGLLPGQGFAAGAKDAPAGKAAVAVDPERLDEYVGESIEVRIRRIAADIIPTKDLQVVVTAHAQVPTAPAYPYLPSFISRDSIAHLSNKELSTFITSASVDLLLSERVNKAARGNLEALVKRKLGSMSAKLEITSNTLAIEVDELPKDAAGRNTGGQAQPKDEGASAELARLKGEAERQKGEADRAVAASQVLERERNDVKHELQLLATQATTAAQEKAKALERERDDAKRASEQAKTQSDSLARELMVTKEGLEIKAFLMKNATAIAAVVAGLLAMFVLVFGLIQLGKQLASSISTIAGSLSEVGTALTNGAEAAAPEAAAAQDKAGQPPEQNINGVGSITANIESVQNRLNELRTHVLTLFADERSESLVLRKISDLLKDPVKAHMAVFGMELLGKEKANAIFKKLGQEAQTQVLECLNSTDYSKPKAELMLEAGEFFQTQLLAEDFYRLAEKIDVQISELMLKLSTDDMTAVATSLTDAELPRFFLYMGPREIAALLTQMRKANEKRFEQVAKLLPRIAEAETARDRDPLIQDALQKQIKAKDNDVHRPYLDYYSSIIDAAGEALSESLVETLSSTSASVRDHLRNQIVTFATVFRLGTEQRDEILDAQPNGNLVALMQMLPEDQQGLVRSAISERRLEMMEDDLGSFKDVPARIQKQRFTQAKARVVDQLKRLRDAGTLDIVDEDKAVKLADAAA